MKNIMHQIIGLGFIFLTLSAPLMAQITMSQTYPILFPRDHNGVRIFPDFEMREIFRTLEANACMNGEFINLELDENIEDGIELTVLTQQSCDDIQLTYQHFLAIEPKPNDYVFTCTKLGQTVWQKNYTFPYFLSKDNVLPTSDGGFYCYQTSPLHIRRYNSGGELLWDKTPISISSEEASEIIKIDKNADFYLRTGHLGGNDLMVKISKISGETGAIIWEQDLTTHRNLAKATHIISEEEASFVIVINNYGAIPMSQGVCGGWDVSFLKKEDGHMLHHFDKMVFGTADIKAVIHPRYGVYFLESQIIDDRFNAVDSTGFYLYHFNLVGEEVWKKTLDTELPFSKVTLPYFSIQEEQELLFLGTRNDSLWRLEIQAEGF